MLYFVNTGLDPRYNQALEEYLFQNSARLAGGEPLLLLWRNRPAVICGRYQNIYGEVNLPYAAARGILPVRRMTGGGTVYHDEGNVNYALLLPWEGRGVSYAECLSPVLRALQKIGVNATLGRESDLMLYGKKISGSAQKIAGGRLLHHGTLLYDADLSALKEVLTPRGRYVSGAIASYPQPTVNIKEVCGFSFSAEEFGLRFLQAMLSSADRCLPENALSSEDFAAVRTLAAEKYGAFSWTFGASPPFTLETVLRGEQRPVRLRVEKGVVTQASEGAAWLLGKRLCAEDCGEDLLRIL